MIRRHTLSLLALALLTGFVVWAYMAVNMVRESAGKCQRVQPNPADSVQQQQQTTTAIDNKTQAHWNPDINNERKEALTVQRALWQKGDPKSETIHLALVLCGKKKAQQARILAESVRLLSPGSPVHWHLIVDDEAMKELDRTRFLAVTRNHRSVYFMEKYFHIFDGTDKFLATRYRNSWMWNKCKGMKVQLPSVIPTTIDRIILIDVDTMIVTPLERLWQHFNDGAHANPAPLFHMAVDMSSVYSKLALKYAGKALRVHPLNIGLNTGVVLMHLDRMRNMSSHPAYIAEGLNRPEVAGQYHRELTDWGRLALHMTKIQPSKIVYVLGDQDMFNAPIGKYPDLASILPCGWNFQLAHFGSTWLSKVCNVSNIEIHLIHGNGNRFMRTQSQVPKEVQGYNALYSGLKNFVLPELAKEEEQNNKEKEGEPEKKQDASSAPPAKSAPKAQKSERNAAKKPK